MDAVKQWKYTPTLLSGEPVEMSTQVTLSFSLAGGSQDEAAAPRTSTTRELPPIRIAGNVTQAKLLHRVDAVYPPIAKAANVQGTVVLRAIIAKDGTVKQLELISGPPMLTDAAMDAVRQWTYQPTRLYGEPVEVETTVSITFTLD